MELAIILMLCLFAFIAWAPEQLTQAALAFAWIGAALFAVVPIIYYGARWLF